MPKVEVACRIVNGITIKRFKPGPDDGTGKQPLASIDGGITLNGPSGLHAGVGSSGAEGAEPGITLVDKDWIEAWLKENEQTALVAESYVAIVPDSEVPDEEPAKEPAQDPSEPEAS